MSFHIRYFSVHIFKYRVDNAFVTYSSTTFISLLHNVFYFYGGVVSCCLFPQPALTIPA